MIGPTWQAPADAALPQLAQALDMPTMAAHFDAMVRPHGLQVLDCRVERAKYRPGRNCSLAYVLQVRGAHDATCRPQRVATRLFAATGEATRRAARVPAAHLVASPAGPALRLLPALNMLAWWWPNDRVLTAPRVLADDARLRDVVLPALLAAMDGPGVELVEHRIDVVQVVPEQRVTARVTLRWRRGDACAPREAVVYAKASRDPSPGVAHAMLAQLQSSPAWRDGRLVTPAAIACQPEHGLHWQQAMAGAPWIDLPLDAQQRLAPALGAQLAALHGTPVDTDRQLDEAALAARLEATVQVLHDSLPDVRPVLHAAAAALRDALADLTRGPCGTLHGDLHPRNILVDGDRLALIDLDGMRRGATVLELGAWAADGLYRAQLDDPAREALSSGPAASRLIGHGVLEGYRRAGGVQPDPRLLALATAWNLLAVRAWRCVVNLKPGRLAAAPGLVAQAAHLARAHRMELA